MRHNYPVVIQHVYSAPSALVNAGISDADLVEPLLPLQHDDRRADNNLVFRAQSRSGNGGYGSLADPNVIQKGVAPFSHRVHGIIYLQLCWSERQ